MEKSKVVKAIIDLLKTGTKSYGELSIKIKCGHGTFDDSLKECLNNKIIQRSKNGKNVEYSLKQFNKGIFENNMDLLIDSWKEYHISLNNDTLPGLKSFVGIYEKLTEKNNDDNPYFRTNGTEIQLEVYSVILNNYRKLQSTITDLSIVPNMVELDKTTRIQAESVMIQCVESLDMLKDISNKIHPNLLTQVFMELRDERKHGLGFKLQSDNIKKEISNEVIMI